MRHVWRGKDNLKFTIKEYRNIYCHKMNIHFEECEKAQDMVYKCHAGQNK